MFHEKSVTAYSAWNRQFDATIANLRFKVLGKTLAIEPTLNFMQDRSGAKRKAAAQALAHTFKDNVAQFALITNTLAKDKEIADRWRGFADIADDRHLSNRVEREVVDALVAAVRAAYPRLSHRYYALKAKWFGKKRLPYWDRNAPLAQVPMRTVGWNEARDTVLTPTARSRRRWRRSPSAFSLTAGSTRRCVPARRRARSRIRPRRPRILTCCSIFRARCATS